MNCNIMVDMQAYDDCFVFVCNTYAALWQSRCCQQSCKESDCNLQYLKGLDTGCRCNPLEEWSQWCHRQHWPSLIDSCTPDSAERRNLLHYAMLTLCRYIHYADTHIKSHQNHTNTDLLWPWTEATAATVWGMYTVRWLFTVNRTAVKFVSVRVAPAAVIIKAGVITRVIPPWIIIPLSSPGND